MRKKQLRGDAIQLSLFMDEGAKEKSVQPLAPSAPSQQVSAEQATAIKERFLALGRHFGYPGFQFSDPRTTFTVPDGRTEMPHGEEAWKQVVQHERISWIAAASKWLEKGEVGSAHTWHQIRAAREDVLLHEALLKRYPQWQVGDLLIAAGEDAWKRAVRALDRSTLEHAIVELAQEGNGQ